MRFKNVLWDWNGTIINDTQLCLDIVNTTLQNHTGRILGIKEYKDVFGLPISEYYLKIGVDFNKESYADLTKSFITQYESRVQELSIHEGVRDIFELFQHNGIKQHILTAAHVDVVHPKLKHFEISGYFDQIVGLDNHAAVSKVEQGIELMTKMNFNRETTVLLGDTDHDYDVAQAMGIHSIMVANGHQSKERLFGHAKKAVAVINNIKEINPFIYE